MSDNILPATYLTDSNNKWLIFKIDKNDFNSLFLLAKKVRESSNTLGDFNIATHENNILSVYWLYSEYVIWYLLGVYVDFKSYIKKLEQSIWLDGGKDIIMGNNKTFQVKYTDWFQWWKHGWDLMNQFERNLSSDYYILVTKGDEYIKDSLRVVWYTTKELFQKEDIKQNQNWYIKKKQRKINRCVIQKNLLPISNLLKEFWINIKNDFKVIYEWVIIE